MEPFEVAANQLVLIFATNLWAITGEKRGDDGVRVTFDGRPGKLLYASPSQSDLLMPTTFGADTATSIEVH
jgi:uncharacterized protein (TIGR03437 family)